MEAGEHKRAHPPRAGGTRAVPRACDRGADTLQLPCLEDVTQPIKFHTAEV